MRYTLSIAFIATLLFAPPSAHALEFAKELDVGQGYNFKPDEHHSYPGLGTSETRTRALRDTHGDA